MMPNPAVAGILEDHFVEARHHTDHTDEAIKKRNKAFQQEYEGNPSMPYYMLINPETDEVYGTFAGAALTLQSFVDFLEEGIAKSEEKAVASSD